MGMFLNAMLDPFVTGRNGGFGAGAWLCAGDAVARAAAAEEAFAAPAGEGAAAVPHLRAALERVGLGLRRAQPHRRRSGVVGSNDLRANAAALRPAPTIACRPTP